MLRRRPQTQNEHEDATQNEHVGHALMYALRLRLRLPLRLRLLPGRLRNKRWGLKKWSPGGPKIDPEGPNAALEVFGSLLGGEGGAQLATKAALRPPLGGSWACGIRLALGGAVTA